MELKDKKFIKNSNIRLPKFAAGYVPQSWKYTIGSDTNPQPRQDGKQFKNADFSSVLNNAGNIGAHTGAVISSFTPETTVASVIANGTQNYRNIGGNYYKTNDIDYRKEEEESINRNNMKWVNSALTGAQMMAGFKNGKLPKFNAGVNAAFGLMGGALIGGIGKAITEGKENERILKAVDIADRQNNFNKYAAYDTVVKDNMIQQYGDTRNQLLSYKCGKNPKFRNGKRVRSAYGLIDAPATGFVDGGEIMKQYDKNGNLLSEHRIPKSKYTDSYPAYVDQYTEIIPEKIAKHIPTYKCGKLPKYVDGIPSLTQLLKNDLRNSEDAVKWEMSKPITDPTRDPYAHNKYLLASPTTPQSRYLTDLSQSDKNVGGLTGYESVAANMPTVIAGIGQLVSGLNEDIKTSNSYVPNRFGDYAADKLRRLHVSDYPILPELYNQYAKTMYAISNSGGLSGGQRTLARLAAMNNLQNNYAKLLQSNQLQNNNYTANYADYISKLGAQEAADRMKAYVFDLDYNSKSHAAKQERINKGIENTIAGTQQIAKDITKYKQFAHMMNLYEQQLGLDKLQVLANIKNS